MKNLQISNLTFSYSFVPVFSKLNLTFEPLWTALVGDNGCGKTTLLGLIAKELQVEQGAIYGNDLLYYAKQDVEDKPLGFDEFSYAFDTQAYRIKESLHIQDEWFYRWDSLSYGERKRVQIAIALYQDVNVLLLDEPTNHLDIGSKKLLINALKSFKGIGVLVSHDREVLDTLCLHTIFIKEKNIYMYKTFYSNALKELKEHIGFLYKENENITKELKKLQKNIKIQKEKISLSKSRLSKSKIDKKDTSTKEKLNRAKLTGKDKNLFVGSLWSKYHQTKQKMHVLDKEFKRGVCIQSSSDNKNKNTLFLKANSLQLSADTILIYPDFLMKSQDKIAIIGDNGVGKSSFIKHVVQNCHQKCFYLPQEIKDEAKVQLFDAIKTLDNEEKGVLFTLLKRLSSNPKNIIDNESLSHGELRKLFIAKALLDKMDFIILDEPTNHMDIDSCLALEKALMEYNKALIVVSHDNIFIKNLKLDIYKIDKKDEGMFYLAKENIK